ncbi:MULTISPECIES: hypothetical protein [unclassified Pseudomonas]|uniref:tyrosine-type recombinase/integrase n=1 Tax=unclassified Pseudomonas TaxID=196821 RepID=UPI000BA433ED|nr:MULTISPECIES: hypothetical protein [unclassified Pseudomonas]
MTNTFAAVAERWYIFKRPRLTEQPRAARSSPACTWKDLLLALGKIPICEVRRADLLIVIRRIEKRGALHVAENCRTWMKQIFSFAVAEGIIDASPATDLEALAAIQPPVSHALILRGDYELKFFLAKLREFRGRMFTGGAISLLLLTGVRAGALRNASLEPVRSRKRTLDPFRPRS